MGSFVKLAINLLASWCHSVPDDSAQVEKLTSDLANLQLRLEPLEFFEADRKLLEKQLWAKDEEIANESKRASVLVAQLSSLEEKYSMLDMEYIAHQRQSDAEIRRLEARVEELVKDHDSISFRLEVSRILVESFKEELSTKDAELLSRDKELDYLRAEVDRLKKKCKDYSSNSKKYKERWRCERSRAEKYLDQLGHTATI